MSDKQPVKYQYLKKGDSVAMRDLKEGDFFIYSSDSHQGYPQIYQFHRVHNDDGSVSGTFLMGEVGSGKLEPVTPHVLVIKLDVSKIELIQ